MNNKNKKLIYSIILLVSLIFLSFLFVYTGDDWAWGSQIGIDRLNNLFKGYNSRYLGNLIVLLLTRSNILKGLIIGITIFGIIFLISKIINTKRIDIYLISTILLLNTPKLIFREAISWTSGFANYATSSFFILLFLYYIKDIQNKKINNKFDIKTFLLLLLGLSTNLFIEHVTIYNTILSIGIVIYYKIKYKELNKNLVSYSIGSILGFILMFLNISTNSGERQLSNNIKDLILKICNNYFGVIYEELIYHNIIINILLIIFMFIMIKNIKINKLQKISFIISLTYILYSILNIIYPTWNIFLNYTPHFEGLYTGIYGLSIMYLLITLIQEKEIKNKIIFYILSIILLTTPLLIVTPIGSRCFFITYILFILIILELYNYLIKEKYITKYIYLSFILIIVLSFIHLFSINLTTYIENKNRLKLIEENKEIIEIKRFTYEDYIHGEGTPTPNTIWEDRYKLFYNIPKNTNIKIIEKN